MRRGGILLRAAVAAVLPLIATGAAPAAEHAVAIENFRFDPEVIEIDPGDTITWTNFDPVEHTVTSDAGLWDSGLFGRGQTYSLTLNDPGTYRYVCIPHPGMDGEITVRGGATAPGAPQDLDAVPGLVPGYVSLTWSPPEDDGGSPVLRYELCRADACFTVVGTAYVDGGNPPLQEVRYTVVAINSFGTGPPSNEACATAGPWLELLDC